MKGSNRKPIARVSMGALVLTLELAGLWACSDRPITGPSSGSVGHASPAVHMATSSSEVQAGEVLWLRLMLTNACWDERAALGMTVSWDADRFEYLPRPEDLAHGSIRIDGEGTARIELRGLAGPTDELDLAFRALVSGASDGFVVEDVTLDCARGETGEPPLPTPW